MKSILTTQYPKRIVLALGLLCALFVGSGALLGLVYFERSDATLVRQLGGYLPAARIGKQTISYSKFLSSRDAMRTYLNSPLAKNQGISEALTPTLEKAALGRLMREIAVNEMAKEKNVTVADEDVRGSFAQMIAMSSSTIPNVAEYLKATFNWTEEQYRENIIRPAILEERVAATMTTDTQMQFVVIQQALTDRVSQDDAKVYLRF